MSQQVGPRRSRGPSCIRPTMQPCWPAARQPHQRAVPTGQGAHYAHTMHALAARKAACPHGPCTAHQHCRCHTHKNCTSNHPATTHSCRCARTPFPLLHPAPSCCSHAPTLHPPSAAVCPCLSRCATLCARWRSCSPPPSSAGGAGRRWRPSCSCRSCSTLVAMEWTSPGQRWAGRCCSGKVKRRLWR